MITDYIYESFKVLYSTPANNKDEDDEIILMSYKEIPSYQIRQIEEENKRRAYKKEKQIEIPKLSLLKIRKAPRSFDKYNLLDTKDVKIFYWSNKLGAHVMQPSLIEKNGVYTMDLHDATMLARATAVKEGKDYNNSELDKYIETINSVHIRYGFARNGYWYNMDAYGGDWARSELSIHFMDGEFKIGHLDVIKLTILSHWEVDEAWDEAKSLLSKKSITMSDFAEFLLMLDTYDTGVSIFCREDSKITEKNIYMDGGKVVRYKEDLAPEILSAIDKINSQNSVNK